MRPHAATVLVLFAVLPLSATCKAREPPPPVDEEPTPSIVQLPDPCQDNDADCPPGTACNRVACSALGLEHGPMDKLLEPCNSDEACVVGHGDRLVCIRGLCRGCMNAEECAPGGERAGWFCLDPPAGRCSTTRERKRIPSPYDRPDIPFPPTDGPPPPPPPPGATASTLPAPPFPQPVPNDAAPP
jgi:hypothetical protein